MFVSTRRFETLASIRYCIICSAAGTKDAIQTRCWTTRRTWSRRRRIVAKADRERVRYSPSSDGAHEGIPVGDHREVDGVQARHRGRENLAAIEERKPLPKVIQGVRFQNGIEVIEMPAHHAA
jgi:hypothetical protein